MNSGVPATLAGLTHIGCVRRQNEDSIFFSQCPERRSLLAVVADGMGGHAGGAVASGMAVDVFASRWEDHKPGSLGDAWLRQVALLANRLILAESQRNPALKGMGTTLVALAQAAAGSVAVAHIGDSRCYRFRQGVLDQVTRDHSLVQQMVDEGTLTEQEAETSPVRNYLTRSLGSQEFPVIDTCTLSVSAGERFLLCSDGLTNMLQHHEIAAILCRYPEDSAACEALLDSALAKGARDNVSVIVCTL